MEQEFVIFKGKKFYVENNKLDLIEIGVTDITEIKGLSELANLTHLNLSFNRIRELKGLENLTNLQELDLTENPIRTAERGIAFELKEDPRTGREYVHTRDAQLIVRYCQDKQAGKKPFVTVRGEHYYVRLMDRLELEGLKLTVINEIEGLERLNNVRYLSLLANQIKEITGLDTLTNLHTLVLSTNKITEIKGLDHLTNLRVLKLNANQIQEIMGLENLTQLYELGLRGNRIQEIKGLDHLTKLRTLDLGYNDIKEVKGLENLLNLKKLKLFGNYEMNRQEQLMNAEQAVRYCQEKAKKLKEGG